MSEINQCTVEDMNKAVFDLAVMFPWSSVEPTGSVYMLGQGQDVDVLVAVPSLVSASQTLKEAGFVLCAATEYGDESSSCWRAFRCGKGNAIIVSDSALFDRWLAAARVCKVLQVQDKRWRAILHEMIKNHRTYEDAMIKTTPNQAGQEMQ